MQIEEQPTPLLGPVLRVEHQAYRPIATHEFTLGMMFPFTVLLYEQLLVAAWEAILELHNGYPAVEGLYVTNTVTWDGPWNGSLSELHVAFRVEVMIPTTTTL